jgi:hypothetical protein
MIETRIERSASASSDSPMIIASTNDCCMEASMTVPCHLRKRRVSFDTIEIFEFAIELGDNPAVSLEQAK